MSAHTSVNRALHASMLPFQAGMRELAERAKSVDLRRYEALETEGEWLELHAATSSLLHQARSLVEQIVSACEERNSQDTSPAARTSSAPARLRFDAAVDAAVEKSRAPSRKVLEDIAFMVQFEFRQRIQRLAEVRATGDAQSVIGECDSSLRRVVKGFGALDLALARVEGASPALDFSSELEDSLRVRQAYAKFRTALVTDGPTTKENLQVRMRAAGTQIAILVGWDAYPLLRPRDRLQLRYIQREILSWLRSPVRDATDGLRLWQNLITFVEMLAQVNLRQELIEHDANVVRTTLQLIAPETTEVSTDLRASLRRILGRDPELDAWLLDPSAPTRALRQTLERLLRQMRSR